jgi:hypothetical protein
MPDPRVLIELVDKWRATAHQVAADCADELETIVNDANRAGVWVPFDLEPFHDTHHHALDETPHEPL